jgi:hypothetical protein
MDFRSGGLKAALMLRAAWMLKDRVANNVNQIIGPQSSRQRGEPREAEGEDPEACQEEAGQSVDTA